MKTLFSTRREFLRTSATAALAAAALPAIIPATALGRDGKAPPSERLNMGCIGVGPQGRGVMGGFLPQKDLQVVALCDVAKFNLDQAQQQVKQRYQDSGCDTYSKFEELLARKDIDAVLIATPDHWHVPVAVAAAKAGKHIYLEKPMGLSVQEDQLLRKIARQKQIVFQFGTQQRSSSEFYRACALVRAGKIGQLKQINVWCSASMPGGSTTPAPVPDSLDYERWLGPARFTPFTADKCFDYSGPGTWKTWWFNYDYALGFIAGWGVHPLDIAFWGHPGMMSGKFEVTGKGLFPKEGACNTSVAWDVNFTFADGVRMQFKGTRNGGEPSPMHDMKDWQAKYRGIADHGTAFEGTDGWVMVSRGSLKTGPEKLAEEQIDGQSLGLLKSTHHARNFLDAIRGKSKSICPIEDAVQADILCHVSDIATRMDRPLVWDPKKEQFVKDKEANRRLEMRPQRQGWRWA